MNDLKNFTTQQLIDELVTRAKVKNFSVAPDVKYQIINRCTIVDDYGPAVLLVITD
ncbi:BC1881 family protein [Desulfitobacterium sp.]|uniref:BC1881 family protein n=1 Tax=Desulfitobacterium sp. TaxID=49981 RepID=UPI002B221970|nr:BC1881 family protein [Desulfitobacterium sp.]MEA4902553.1 BC1881 family protein [Desulfitobacterium sp.]